MAMAPVHLGNMRRKRQIDWVHVAVWVIYGLVSILSGWAYLEVKASMAMGF